MTTPTQKKVGALVKWAGALCAFCVTIGAWAQTPSLRVGLNFVSTVQGETEQKSTAPDANGGVGPAHVVELINGEFKVYDKKSGKLLLAQSSEAFWEKALGAEAFATNRHNSDPRIVFDAQAGHWYASAQRAGTAAVTAGEMTVVVARSDGTDPLAGWKGVSFGAIPEVRPKHGADFDRLGYTRDGIFLSSNQLGTRPDGKLGFEGVALFSIKKSDFLQDPPVLTLDRRDHIDDVQDATPVVDADGSGSAGTFWGVIQGRAARTANADLFVRTDLQSGPTKWTLDRTTTTIGTRPGQIFQKTDGPPLTVAQPEGRSVLTAGKRPGPSVPLVRGEFWMAHAVVHPADPKRSAIRWWRVRASDNTVLGEGVLADPALSLLIPSIAVDTEGHVLIGCAGTSATQFLSAYAISGRVSGNTVVFDPAFTLVKAGAGVFASNQRWGDYTTTAADPSAPGTFWTFLLTATAKGEWATQITQLIVADKTK
jgi:hypothetical protein